MLFPLNCRTVFLIHSRTREDGATETLGHEAADQVCAAAEAGEEEREEEEARQAAAEEENAKPAAFPAWSYEPEDVLDHYGVAAESGLSDAQVGRSERFGARTSWTRKIRRACGSCSWSSLTILL